MEVIMTKLAVKFGRESHDARVGVHLKRIVFIGEIVVLESVRGENFLSHKSFFLKFSFF